jgi:glycosyltransferase involved in cell wall biosynthesis
MKILWISPFFLHPTDRGGQIRSLGTLKELHRRHEIHFAALNDPSNTEGPERSREYSSSYTAIDHVAPKRGSAGMVPQLIGSLLSSVPLAVSRYASVPLKNAVAKLSSTGEFDCIVCDFLAAVPNVPNMGDTILFQHNVESTIWQRHITQAKSALKKTFFAMQAKKMEAYERHACRESKSVIAVSEVDAIRMKEMFGIERVQSVPTGVDVEYFHPPTDTPRTTDLVFCGSMDWMPNIDAVEHFLVEILPLIRQQRPGTTVTIAGRSPGAEIQKLAREISGVTVTGTVPDMRPHLWNASVSIVPIRIGGGTRLKIYECMAAGLPVVSTTIGAEGLTYTDGSDILIANTPSEFATACLQLLKDEDKRQSVAQHALSLVETHFSWAAITREFEAILERNRLRH